MLSILESAFHYTLKSHISTMTIFYKLQNARIDVGEISDLYKSANAETWRSIWNGKHYLVRIQGSRKTKKAAFRSFSNSISLVTHSSSKKTICAKIFRNGGIQVTGCQSEEQSLEIVNDITRFLKTILKNREEALCIESSTINMINIVCNIKDAINYQAFDLEQLSNLLQQDSVSNLIAKYDREKYFGLSVKVPLQLKQEEEEKKTSMQKFKRAHPNATVLIFSSGMFVITGVKCTEHVQIVNDKFIKLFEKIYRQCIIS